MKKYYLPFAIVAGLICLFTVGITACSKSNDNIERIDGIYNEVIRILQDASTDVKQKKEKIDTFWNLKKTEIEQIRQSLIDEISKAINRSEREKYVKRFDLLVQRLLEIKQLMKEKGIEL
jgi:hypothetical protein